MRKNKENAFWYTSSLENVEDESHTLKSLSPKNPNSILELNSDDDDKKDYNAGSDSTNTDDNKNKPDLLSMTLQAELGEFITAGEKHN